MTTKETKQKTLAEKMASVMGQVIRIKKGGKNEHFRYTFATSEDVSDTIRELLAAEGVAFVCSMDEIEQTPAGKGVRTVAKFTMKFTDGSDAETATWYSEALDSQDKGVNKCATAAVKYFLLKTFIMSSGDEVDTDAQAPIETKEKSRKATPQQMADIEAMIAETGADRPKVDAFCAQRFGCALEDIDENEAMYLLQMLKKKRHTSDADRVKERLNA